MSVEETNLGTGPQTRWTPAGCCETREQNRPSSHTHLGRLDDHQQNLSHQLQTESDFSHHTALTCRLWSTVLQVFSSLHHCMRHYWACFPNTRRMCCAYRLQLAAAPHAACSSTTSSITGRASQTRAGCDQLHQRAVSWHLAPA